MGATAASPQQVTALVRRRIKPGQEAKFEALMQEFIAFVLQQPGHLGINVIRTSPESSEYTILDRFATPEARNRFTGSLAYQEWMQRIGAVTVGCPDVEELGGLAFWFDIPHKAPRRPPKLKMAALTLLGVYPLSMGYPILVAWLIPAQPIWVRGFFIASLIVVTLTWIVMPALTRLFGDWLFPRES